MKSLHIALATILAAAVVAPAHAIPRQYQPRQRVVSYADLDLTKEAGIQTLYARIRSASRDVCWTGGISQVVHSPGMKQCSAYATANAVADVNSPLLTRLHEERTGTTVANTSYRLSARSVKLTAN